MKVQCTRSPVSLAYGARSAFRARLFFRQQRLRGTFGIDVETCPKCGGRMRLLTAARLERRGASVGVERLPSSASVGVEGPVSSVERHHCHREFGVRHPTATTLASRRNPPRMDPVELLARLSALISPPRHPLLRFHGVLGPHPAWRKSAVPEPVVADLANGSTCATTTEVGGSIGPAVSEPPSIPVVAKTRAVAAEGDREIDAPRLHVPLGATEAVLDPARLFSASDHARSIDSSENHLQRRSSRLVRDPIGWRLP